MIELFCWTPADTLKIALKTKVYKLNVKIFFMHKESLEFVKKRSSTLHTVTTNL